MTDEQILTVIETYETHVHKLGIKPREFPHHEIPKTREDKLGHILSMCPEMRLHVKESKRGKVFRWLGFMQGVIWSEGLYPMTELRAHNRSL